jgi:hypothetical protein
LIEINQDPKKRGETEDEQPVSEESLKESPDFRARRESSPDNAMALKYTEYDDFQ